METEGDSERKFNQALLGTLIGCLLAGAVWWFFKVGPEIEAEKTWAQNFSQEIRALNDQSERAHSACMAYLKVQLPEACKNEESAQCKAALSAESPACKEEIRLSYVIQEKWREGDAHLAAGKSGQ